MTACKMALFFASGAHGPKVHCTPGLESIIFGSS